MMFVEAKDRIEFLESDAYWITLGLKKGLRYPLYFFPSELKARAKLMAA
jgi:hypothetical protein